MTFYIITIFPEITSCLKYGVLGKAMESGVVKVVAVNPRDFTTDRHRTVDDEPYGGGAGMVMKPEPIVEAIEHVRKKSPNTKVIMLSPRGSRFTQDMARKLAEHSSITLVCGRYEGIDERVMSFVDEAVSIGDYVLSGGEFAALCIVDAVARHIPGVLGCPGSLEEESFSRGLLEYPQYTRPAVFRGMEVPQVLRSGNHRAIALWRRVQQLKETLTRRPDLLAYAPLSEEDKKLLTEIVKGKA